MVKLPKVALDLDGVIVNFHQRLIDVFNERYPTKKLTVVDINCEIESLGPELAPKLLAIFNEEGWFLNLDPFPNAISTASSFDDLGYDVTVCTAPARDINGKINPSSASEKYVWMNQWLPMWANNMIITKHKELIGTDILVDDTGYNIINWCRENPDGIGFLIDQPWNQTFTKYPTNSTRGNLEDVPTFIDKFWCRKRGKFIYRLEELKSG
jgi:5'(3')-deoxyribonucleotidase